MQTVASWTIPTASARSAQRLLLISGELFGLELVLETLQGSRACVVTTAAKVLDNPLDYLGDIEELESMGLSCSTLDIEDTPIAECEAAIDEADLLVVAGGSPRHLAAHAAANGFGKLVKGSVRSGRIAYLGVSAGAAIAGETVGPTWDEPIPGWGVVDFTIVPHACWTGVSSGSEPLEQSGPARRTVSLSDSSVVVVRGDTATVFGSEIDAG